MRIIRKYANQPHQSRPNNHKEVRKTIVPFISKLKKCAHTNEANDNSNGKLNRVQSQNPSPS
jgi:hypothetical protein